MLDIDSLPTQPVRSMLDVGEPTGVPVKQVLSNPSSPVEASFRSRRASGHPRSLSDAASKPVSFGPRSTAAKIDPTLDYQFSGIITNHAGAALPKRVTLGGKKAANPSMMEVMRGNDVSGLTIPGDGRGRHYSIAGPSSKSKTASKSKSPSSRLGVRSHSPKNNLINNRHLSPAGRAILQDSQTLDLNNAYRRLSDARLAISGGSLSELPTRKRTDDVAGSGRLAKSYLSPDGDLLPDDSSDDEASSSEEEGHRGRKAARAFDKAEAGSASSQSPESTRIPKSLLAAAEEERIEVAKNNKNPAYRYRSLLDDPEITVTNPSGEKVKPTKSGIHPATSFDLSPGSGTRTPADSDTEADFTDIKRAQKLSFSMTPIMDTAESHRAIRIITRGDYSKFVQEAEEENRTIRKYLVATDLSEESAHALEWAIGTVLRDGDTLIAIYCVDEETGIVTGEGGLVPDEHKAMQAQAQALQAVSQSKAPVTPGGSNVALKPSPLIRSSPLAHAAGLASVSPSPAPSMRERSKAEEERYRAVDDITDRITKLLRKTRLQVRAIVEVLHCKNPRHLITEVIDLVNPTLVILGSRGRSALKGVILGSFSNYLVTKSSVPVMVARKRLKKQSKYKRPLKEQVNNISNPTARSLASAKID
ncbi:hypothetical protein DL546_009134 [Coniochaeta pulveracea]|nr:hypothetical protein DL546_009134 [Coniochaeta pulveracea]